MKTEQQTWVTKKEFVKLNTSIRGSQADYVSCDGQYIEIIKYAALGNKRVLLWKPGWKIYRFYEYGKIVRLAQVTNVDVLLVGYNSTFDR